MYGVKINFKSGAKVVELPRPHEFRKETPVFALATGNGSEQRLTTAPEIRRNWNAWASELLPASQWKRLTVQEAEKRGIEIL